MSLEPLHFILSGDPATRTGGYLYDARIVAGLRTQGREVVLHALSDRFPEPDAAALAEAEAVLAAMPAGRLVVIDGLALGGMPALVRAEAERLRLVALVHHPLALETGLTAGQQERLYRQERDALAAVRRVIVTSPGTRAALAGYGVPAERIGVVEPGVDPAPLATGSGGPEPVLLCVATLTPRKGHEVLLRALDRLRDRPWRLVCAGDTRRDPATAASVRALIAGLGLADRVTFAGELAGEALGAVYRGADVFVLASHYEGYGMALAEALAHGLPVVSTTAGAIPGTVPPAAGLLVPPGDAEAFAEALARVLDFPALRERLAAGARAARAGLAGWDRAAERFAAELDRVDGKADRGRAEAS